MKSKLILFLSIKLIICQLLWGLDFAKTSHFLLNFPDHEPTNYFRFTKSENIKISTKILYSDIYRKISNDQTLSQAHAIEYGTQLEIPIEIPSFRSLLQLKLDRNIFKYNNSQDQVAVNSKVEYKNVMPHLRMVLGSNKTLLGIGFKKQFHQGTSTNLINTFPNSDNKNLNKYFLDLLQPSFGDSIIADLNNSGDLLFEFWFSRPVFSDLRLLVYFKQISNKDHITFLYQNNSQKQELQGARQIQLSQRKKDHAFDIHLKFDQNIFKKFQVGFRTGSHDIDLSNIGYEKYDIVELGDGNLHYFKSYSRLFLQPILDLNIQVGIGYGSHTGNGEVSTPVLGYYQYIFPISHSADGQIQNWNSLSWLAKCSYNHNLAGFENTLAVSYIHSRNWLDLEATTHLEFGLQSDDYQTSLIYYVNFWEIGYQFHYKFDRIVFCGGIQQLIPIVNEKKEKPKPTPPKPSKKYRETGGRFYSLSIGYEF